MALNHANRLRASLRQRRRRARSLEAAPCRAQLCAIALAALLALAGVTLTWAQASPTVEYQVKAAFLLNFAKFVEWPPDAFHSKNAPITLCVFGYDPLGSALDEVIRGKTIHDRAVLARRINELRGLKSCQLVFVSNKEYRALPEILDSLKGASGLVVGEGEDFAERGGGIQLFLEDNRLRFAVNVDAVRKAHLSVSSKLLALARIVHDKGHPKGS